MYFSFCQIFSPDLSHCKADLFEETFKNKIVFYRYTNNYNESFNE